MLIKRLQQFFTALAANKSSPQMIFWFSLSLTFAAIYGILALKRAFSGEYVVQDDARQHVFWMRRFLDADLFPHDLIANYFQSIAPLGYSTVYQIGAFVGIDPLICSKLLPLVLGLLTTIYCFGVCVQLLPVPITGFIGALLLNQNLWMQDGLISATPKAFLYPLFLAFLYYLLRRSLIPCLVAIALLGLFYPSLIFVCAGILILQLFRLDKFRLRSPNRRDYLFCAAGLGVAILVLSPYALNSSTFGPVITATQARTLPEFLLGGRASFFNDTDPWEFWFNASRSGIRLPPALMPPLVYAGFVLPILLRYPSRFPLSKRVSAGIIILPQLILASLAMFFAAHALLFKLHLPSRYTQHSLRIVMVTAAAIALTLLLDGVFATIKDIQKTSLATPPFLREVGAIASCFLLISTLVLYPITLKSFLWTGYVVGGVPELYKFFQQQPKDILIASLADEANNLPTFSQRSILVGSEYAIPYHQGYYREFRKKTIELIQAQYSQDLTDVQQLIEKYGIDFWLLDQNAFTPSYLASDRWISQYQPLATEAYTQMQQGNSPALSKITERCSIFTTKSFIVLQANCIKEELKE